MKKALIILPKLLLLAVGILLGACDKPAKEQAVAATLNQELEFQNARQPADEEKKLSWLRKADCMKSFSKPNRLFFTVIYSWLAEINKLYKQIEAQEKIFTLRYASTPADKELHLTDADRKALAEIESQTKNLLVILEKTEEPRFTDFRRFINPQPWASKSDKRKNWTALYLENKPACLAILHLNAFKAALQALKLEIVSIGVSKLPTECYLAPGKIFTEYRLLTDTLKPDEDAKAIVFLGSIRRTFPCHPFSNEYPKAFLFNKQELPILQDEKTNDLVVKIKIPTTDAELKGNAPIKKNWSGKWIIGQKDGKDTIINISGSFILLPESVSNNRGE